MRVVALVALVGCAHPTPADPSQVVRADLDRAETAERARQHEVARRAYEQAIADAHDAASADIAHYKFGETLATWGEFPAALAQFEAAVAAAPSDAAAWHDLGVVREHEGNVPGAITALERARDLAPDDFRPRRTLAVLLWKHGYRDRAAAEYRDMLKFDLPERLRTKVLWALDQLAKSP
jgi:Tfp pilus assembly protein PilF